MIPASKYGQASDEHVELVLTDDELSIKDSIKVCTVNTFN